MALKYWFSSSGVNVAFHAGGDDVETIMLNRAKSIHGFDVNNLAYLNQIHSNLVQKCDNGGLVGDGDALVIDRSGLIGLIMTADCNPIIMYDKVQDVLCMIHAGRLGVENGIVYNGFEFLKARYNARADNIFVYVGPSIRKCCYEVKNDVFNGNMLLSGRIVYNGIIYLDLIKVLMNQFKDLGFSDILVDDICTCCNGEYFSYRRDKNCGRIGLFATIV